MNRQLVVGGLLIALAALAGGYQWGSRSREASGDKETPAAVASSKPARKLLYYRNPMGLPDTSPVPRKDSMGMDYIAVYAGDETSPAGEAGVSISSDKVQKLGVRTELAALRELPRSVRAAGRIEVDERRLYAVSTRFDGWIEKLHVAAGGQPVVRGQPLAEVYSPELVSAQKEYLLAVHGKQALAEAGAEAQRSMQQLAEASLARLRNWEISAEQISRLRAGGEAQRLLTLRSPAAGVVVDKKAVAGMRFTAGEMLYQVADLSSVWAIADVFEQDIAHLRVGQPATVRINAFPDKVFTGRVAYIYPMLKAETRSVPVRVELANPGGLLRPAMYATLELSASSSGRVLTVPVSAVIDSGVRRIVLVQSGEGRFSPRVVRLGTRAGEHVEVIDGLRAGEAVVVAANFLIDAESNLQAAISGFGRAAEGSAPPPSGSAPPADHSQHAAPPATPTVPGGHAGHSGHAAGGGHSDHAGH